MAWTDVAGAVSGALGGIGGLIQTGYNIYSAKRDFDYQKSLQNKIFEREDDSVYRRMQDLKAAGINPNLAAGSGAGAGAVVGRSNTPQLSGNPIGTALDMATAVQQLRNQKEQNEILKNQKRESEANANMAQNANVLDQIELQNLLGLKSYIRADKNGNFKVMYGGRFPDTLYDDGSYEYNLEKDNSRIMQYLDWQYQNNQNSAALLQKDNDWYTADKIGNMISGLGSLYSSFGSGYRNFKGRR